jgi:DNA-binding XRE family transcriptional regulator
MELNLKDTQVAQRAGLSIDEYFDVELHPDEIYTVTPLGTVKNLAHVLGFDFMSLFEMPCPFCCGAIVLDDYSLPRNVLIRKKRENKGLSADQLGDRIGFATVAVNNMEADPAFLETWALVYIQELAEAIDVPFQVLLAVKCTTCNN